VISKAIETNASISCRRLEETGSLNPDREPEDDFGPIFRLLRDATEVDFSLYRENMIRRRIVRRLA